MSDETSSAALDAVPAGAVVMVGGPGGVGKTTVSRLVAATFDVSVHIDADDFLASIVSGAVDPNLAAAERQNDAVGGALAVSTMSFAQDGYTTVLDGCFLPENARGLAAACTARGLAFHYVVLTADLDTCWKRASSRSPGRWPLEYGPFAAVHQRFAATDLHARHLVDATASPERVSGSVVSALRDRRLVFPDDPSADEHTP